MHWKENKRFKGLEGQAVLSVLLGMLLAGCGGSDHGLVPVSGKVTLDDGPVPAAGRLIFAPTDGAQGLRTAIANFDTSGTFKVQFLKSGDGLESGAYLVGVTCWKVPPTMDGPAPVSYLPARYKNPATSGLRLTVPSNDHSPITFPVQLSGL